MLKTWLTCGCLAAAVALGAPAILAGSHAEGEAPAKPSLTNPASLADKAPDVFQAKFETSKGDFVVEVRRNWAPIGADRFYNLVKYGFYDDAHFFRVVPNFVVQFGINAKPEISQAWTGATLRDELVRESNRARTLVFAKTSRPNSRTTQVFINLKNNPHLDKSGFSPFGEVVEGWEVVTQLYSGYGDGMDQTKIRVVGKKYLDDNFPRLDSIKKATIVDAPAGDGN